MTADTDGGPGRRLCAITGTWVVDGSCADCGTTWCTEGPGGAPCIRCEMECPMWEDTEEPGNG